MKLWPAVRRMLKGASGWAEVPEIFEAASLPGQIEILSGTQFSKQKGAIGSPAISSWGGAVLIAVCTGSLIWAGIQAVAGIYWPIQLTVCSMFCAMLVVIAGCISTGDPLRQLKEHAAQLARPDRWFVHVQSSTGGSSYGWIWREGAALHFSGDHYNFAVCASDFEPNPKLFAHLFSAYGAALRHRPGIPNMRLLILPMQRTKRVFALVKHPPEFLQEMETWRAAEPVNAVQSVLPPLQGTHQPRSLSDLLGIACLYGLAGAVPVGLCPLPLPENLQAPVLQLGVFFICASMSLSELTVYLAARRLDHLRSKAGLRV